MNELETVCSACNGTKYAETSSGFFKPLLGFKDTCSTCDGKGYILTAKGKEMVKFIIRHVTTGMDGGGLHKKSRR